MKTLNDLKEEQELFNYFEEYIIFQTIQYIKENENNDLYSITVGKTVFKYLIVNSKYFSESEKYEYLDVEDGDIQIVGYLSFNKMKIPLILFDAPELDTHTKYLIRIFNNDNNHYINIIPNKTLVNELLKNYV